MKKKGEELPMISRYGRTNGRGEGSTSDYILGM